jgi:hypothetical protein
MTDECLGYPTEPGLSAGTVAVAGHYQKTGLEFRRDRL